MVKRAIHELECGGKLIQIEVTALIALCIIIVCVNYANALLFCVRYLLQICVFFLSLAENTLYFLDPHTTQPVVDIDQWGHIADESYHCSQVSQMFISSLDPSIALVGDWKHICSVY